MPKPCAPTFDEDITHTTRLVSCPNCESTFRVPCSALEYVCGECGEIFPIEPEGPYPEEFIWHPRNKY
jgi:DNA-directed RNA polymerase subunit RPC12/RpoP